MAKALQLLAGIGEEALELAVTLAVMIMVERANGQGGLGVYAYLSACLFALRYLSNYGVSNWVERETGRTDTQSRQLRLMTSGLQACLITGLAASLLLLATAGFDTSHTRVAERMAAYFIMALALPVANLNHLKLSVLHGRGRHGLVARMGMLRQGCILAAAVLLTRFALAPSYLLVIFLLADSILAAVLRRHLKLPPLRKAFNNMGRLVDTLKQGQAYLFTDNALNLLLNVDLFILGMFVSESHLGLYAEAAVLVRFFLIVPVGIRPILRRGYAIAAAGGHMGALADRLRRNHAVLFTLYVVMALEVLLYFPAVLEFFFGTRAGAAASFKVFTLFVPGLVFFGPLCAHEPVYESLDQVDRLKRLTLSTAVLNLLLTMYLVPVAGPQGAAAATMMTMLVYAGRFGRKLPITGSLDRGAHLAAGLGLYLLYMLLRWTTWSALINIWAVPLMAGLLLYACGIYGVRSATAEDKDRVPAEEAPVPQR